MTKTTTISVRVPASVGKKLEKIAKERGNWTTSELVKDWIKEKMEEEV